MKNERERGSSRIEDFEPPEVSLSDEQRVTLMRVHAWAYEFFRKAKEEGQVIMGGHGIDHNERVAGMAAVLATLENKDPFLPTLTALLFDIGRTSTDSRARNWRHGELSREMASDFINSLPLSEEDNVMVKNAIEDHPKLNGQIPEERRSWLQMILQDADRLDTLGTIGIARASASRWELPLFSEEGLTEVIEANITTSFQDYAYYVPKWLDSMWTKSGREIAEARMPHMRAAIEEIRKEAGFMLRAFKSLQIES